MGTDITVTTATRPASGLGQITPEPYVQHSDVLGSPSQGPLEASAAAAIARLPDVGATAGGLVLTEIKTTIPADNMPSPSSFQPPAQVSVTGVDLGHPGLGPLATARLVSSRAFAPDLYEGDHPAVLQSPEREGLQADAKLLPAERQPLSSRYSAAWRARWLLRRGGTERTSSDTAGVAVLR